MNKKIELPNEIIEEINNRPYNLDGIGKSNSKVLIFDDMVLKIEKYNDEVENEITMMNWLNSKKLFIVPHIIKHVVQDNISYLLMTKIDGKIACDDEYLSNPPILLDIIKEAITLLQGIDITNCPCLNDLEKKLKDATYLVSNRLVDIDDVEPETFNQDGFKSFDDLLDFLKNNKPQENFYFVHGDLSLPNIIVKNNHVIGFVDLGKMGISDKWQDLAIVYRSLKHNFNGHYNGGHPYKGYYPEMLFEKLNITCDEKKLKYFLLLDEIF